MVMMLGLGENQWWRRLEMRDEFNDGQHWEGLDVVSIFQGCLPLLASIMWFQQKERARTPFLPPTF
jgi:hypothetical protein